MLTGSQGLSSRDWLILDLEDASMDVHYGRKETEFGYWESSTLISAIKFKGLYFILLVINTSS